MFVFFTVQYELYECIYALYLQESAEHVLYKPAKIHQSADKKEHTDSLARPPIGNYLDAFISMAMFEKRTGFALDYSEIPPELRHDNSAILRQEMIMLQEMMMEDLTDIRFRVALNRAERLANGAMTIEYLALSILSLEPRDPEEAINYLQDMMTSEHAREV